MILAGDIGGTKTHLALFEEQKRLKIIKEEVFLCEEFSSLLSVIKKFLSSKNVSYISEYRLIIFCIKVPMSDFRICAKRTLFS